MTSMVDGVGAQFWEEQHERYLEKDWIDKPTIFARQIIDQLPPGGKLLDLGAGQGQDSRFFAEHGFLVTSVERSAKALALARKKSAAAGLVIDIQAGDLARDLAFSDASFDGVYAHLALHYFDAATTTRIFRDLHRVLKPNGILGLLVNTTEDPEIPRLEPIERDYYREPSSGLHKRYFSPESIRSFTQGLFDPLLLDRFGKTYKDTHETLVRFVGRKI